MNYGHLSIKKTLDDADLHAQYGQTWVWAAIESATRLIVCYLVGDRTLPGVSYRTVIKGR